MTLEMRELKGDDLFTMLGIVGKLDIKDDFVKMFETNSQAEVVQLNDFKDKKPTKAEQKKIDELKAKEIAETEKRGMEAMAGIMQKVMLNAKHLKVEINALLADLTGESVATISNLGLKEYTALLVEFFRKPELADFFSSIASLL
jgi:predicted metal-dependent TIM-barrel fold hydrolase